MENISLPILTSNEILNLISICMGDICVLTTEYDAQYDCLLLYVVNPETKEKTGHEKVIKYHASINLETKEFGLNEITKEYNQDLIDERYFDYILS